MEERATRDLEMSDGASDDDMPLTLPTEGGHGGSIRKGCDPLAQTQRSKLQHRRARINQQINKEMRMRAGAENLFREVDSLFMPMMLIGNLLDQRFLSENVVINAVLVSSVSVALC